MRPPRYRFPDQVRTTAREMVARMVRAGEVPTSPEALESWIEGHPEVQSSLERGGYGEKFTSADLFPLVQVFAGVTDSAPAVTPVRSTGSPVVRRVAIIAALLIAAVLLFLFLPG